MKPIKEPIPVEIREHHDRKNSIVLTWGEFGLSLESSQEPMDSLIVKLIEILNELEVMKDSRRTYESYIH